MSRLMRGLGSLTVLVLGLAGVPVALLVLGTVPSPQNLSWAAVGRALLTRDDGTVLIGLVTVVAWIAWLVFAASVVSELIGLVSHRRIRVRLPGLAGPQGLAAGLLISVLAMFSVSQLAQPEPAGPAPTAAQHAVAAPPATTGSSTQVAEPPAATLSPSTMTAPEAAVLPGPVGKAESPGHRHVVKSGDDLWSLAETYYGDGQAWRKIATANPGRLTGGPDRLKVGWVLTIPDVADADQPSGRQATVRRGDTLSSIAARELGSEARWQELFRANRAQLADPDELAVGMRLALPATSGQRAQTHAHREPPRDPSKAKGSPDDRPRDEDQRPPEPTAAPSDAGTPASEESAPVQPGSDAPASAEPAAILDVALPAVGVGALLAAALVAGFAARRRVQLQSRPLGRRILVPAETTRALEVSLGRRQRPLSLRSLDQAMRAVAAHCRTTDAQLPSLQLALVGDEEIELRLASARADPPPGFSVRGSSWVVEQSGANLLSSVEGFGEAPRPWPALVTLGRDDRGREVLADLEAFGILQLQADSPASTAAVLAAMTTELSFSPWADEMILTLVGGGNGLPEALGKHNVSQTDDLDALLNRLEQRAAVQREHGPYAVLGQHRIDPDLADPWAPEIVLVSRPISEQQSHRLSAVMLTGPRVTMAAIVTGPSMVDAPWSFVGSGAHRMRLEPAGLTLLPQRLESAELDAVLDLVTTTGSDQTTPAPWWSVVPRPPEPPPDNVTYVGRWAGSQQNSESGEGVVIMRAAAMSGGMVHDPTLALLGPIELHGATGTLPVRAAKQCLEYCAWLLEHPGTTAQAMSSALAVAEGTRRSNMSRLRTWLGDDEEGQAYLPDAYTGRIALHRAVSSDWHLIQLLTTSGVNRSSDDALHAALELVRGAPLADAAPGQWHWAEELRTDMISCVRDIGVELADRALLAGDVDRARWAAARALAAAPGDELLLSARIRTEHLAGNHVETERLSLQLAAQARLLGVDLDPETVSLLQRVMEGRVRARLA